MLVFWRSREWMHGSDKGRRNFFRTKAFREDNWCGLYCIALYLHIYTAPFTELDVNCGIVRDRFCVALTTNNHTFRHYRWFVFVSLSSHCLCLYLLVYYFMSLRLFLLLYFYLYDSFKWVSFCSYLLLSQWQRPGAEFGGTEKIFGVPKIFEWGFLGDKFPFSRQKFLMTFF